jgi:hypothetical protein
LHTTPLPGYAYDKETEMESKSLAEYLTDPRLDPDDPEYIKEIHAIRLRIQDESEGMTYMEFAKDTEQRMIETFTRYNIPIKWADLKPVTPLHPTGRPPELTLFAKPQARSEG